MLTLISLNGQDKGRVFQLAGEKPELLGRQATKIRLTDAQTSRRHAEVLLENNTWLIRDLDSTNGTWVNGQKIVQITELEAGDRIVIGRHQFRVGEIINLPAPTPQPKAPQPEPTLGHEELTAMGVDLDESLSADLLDDESLDLPDVPESSHSNDVIEPALTAAAQSESPADNSPDAPDIPDTPLSDQAPQADTVPDIPDGVIDLDALLPADPPQEQPSPTRPPEDDPTPSAVTPDEEEDHNKPKPPAQEPEQGFIDLDALLAEAPPSTQDAPAADSPPPPTVEAISTDADAEVDFDLDEMLGVGEAEDPPPASAAPEDVPTVDVPDEAVTDEEVPDEAESAKADAPPSVDEPVWDAEHPVEVTDEQAATTPVDSNDGDDSDVDSIDDLDALLEDIADQHETTPPDPDTSNDHALATPSAPIPTPDAQADPDPAPPPPPPPDHFPDHPPDQLPDQLPDQPPASADQNEPPASLTQPDQEPDAPTQGDEPDSLIDIDILASAKPTDSWTHTPPATQDDGDLPPAITDAEPADDLDDSGIGTDGSAIMSSAATNVSHDEEPDHDTPDDDTPETVADAEQNAEDDPAVALNTIEDEAEQAQDEAEPDEAAADDEADELADSERVLLLTPDEQTQAVQGYKRSRLKTLVSLVLILTTLGVAGWYAINRYTNRADANSLPPKQQAKASPRAANNPKAITTVDGPSDPSAQPAPSAPPPTLPKPAGHATPKDTQPVPGDHNTEPKAPPPSLPDTTPYDTLKPTPEMSAPATPTSAMIADPFADVTTTVIDPPPSAPTTPDAQADDTPPDAATPDPTPESDPGSVTTDALTEVTAHAQPLTDKPDTSDNGHQTELDLLAGAVDAQHVPGDRVSDQAAFAGARRTAYVVDASGSLVDSFPQVLSKLNQTISNLPEDQAFTVIFFGADGVIEVPPVGLKWADHQNTRQVRRWIAPASGNVTAWGRGNLMQALQLAAGYGVDEIVVLSDNLIGRHASQEQIDTLLDDIADVIDGQVEQIHVTQFFTRDPKQVLKSIAERFNGTYNLIPTMPNTANQNPADDPRALP